MTRRFALIFAFAALGLASPALAQVPYGPAPSTGPDSLGADWGPQQDQARAAVKQGRYLSLLRVIAIVRQRTPGRQLDCGLELFAGRAVYRVRWAANDGRRIDYIVDAESGAILSP